MQKWLPEPFADDVAPVGAVAVESSAFQAESSDDATEAEQATRRFRREAGFRDTQSMMASLTHEERAQVFELVELDVAEEYVQREAALRQDFDEKIAASAADFDERFRLWTEILADFVAQEVQDAAASAARLSVSLAEKIVRDVVPVDREVLSRNLATILFKLESDQPLTVRVNPEDAVWLAARPELRDKLHIAVVEADRRIESGGAQVQAAGREWDAGLAGQMESLAELVEEMIATGTPPAPPEAVPVNVADSTDDTSAFDGPAASAEPSEDGSDGHGVD